MKSVLRSPIPWIPLRRVIGYNKNAKSEAIMLESTIANTTPGSWPLKKTLDVFRKLIGESEISSRSSRYIQYSLLPHTNTMNSNYTIESLKLLSTLPSEWIYSNLSTKLFERYNSLYSMSCDEITVGQSALKALGFSTISWNPFIEKNIHLFSLTQLVLLLSAQPKNNLLAQEINQRLNSDGINFCGQDPLDYTRYNKEENTNNEIDFYKYNTNLNKTSQSVIFDSALSGAHLSYNLRNISKSFAKTIKNNFSEENEEMIENAVINLFYSCKRVRRPDCRVASRVIVTLQNTITQSKQLCFLKTNLLSHAKQIYISCLQLSEMEALRLEECIKKLESNTE